MLLLTFTLINIQLISFSMLMGQFFHSITRSFIILTINWVIMNILSFQQFDGIYLFILCLNPYFSFIYLFRHLFLYERSMTSIDLFKKLYSWTPLLSNIFLIQFISIPFYWILIWYWENLFPG
jgi:hypothetical protein